LRQIEGTNPGVVGQVIGNQSTADWPLRVIVEGSARANPQPAHKSLKENRLKNRNALQNQTRSRILLTAFATALAAAFSVALPRPAYADDVTPPPVPANIVVPVGNEAFLVGHAVGTQNYVCLPSGTGVAFTLFTPQATLFSDDGKQLTTHFQPQPV
jgi:hypothetical protein